MRERVLLYCPESKSCNQRKRKEKKKMKLETYEAAIAAIEKTRNKVSKRVSANTTLHKIVAVDGTVTVGVKLYDTFVVIMHPDHSVLFSGGFKTSTTKKRINNYSLCSIFQKDFEWFVKDGTPFEEGIVVDRGGALLSLTPQSLECASFILPPLTPLVIGT